MYSTGQIKEWLEGWYIDNNKNTSLSLSSIIVLLECDQDGIEAYFERKEYYSKEKNFKS